MGPLGLVEIVLILVLYVVIVPVVLSIALRIFIYFAEVCRVPEAICRFTAKSAKAFQAQRAPTE